MTWWRNREMLKPRDIQRESTRKFEKTDSLYVLKSYPAMKSPPRPCLAPLADRLSRNEPGAVSLLL